MNYKVETLDRSFKENIQIEYPKDLTEIINLINSNKKISLIGSGLSFVPNFASKESISICLKKNFNKIKNIDLDKNIVHVECGITVRKLLNIISKEKKFLKILPGWPEVTIGGCIANNVHGKNPYRDGVFQEIVEEIEIILPGKSSSIIANRDKNKELFYNTCGGYGLTGLIISAKIKLSDIKSTNFLHKKVFTLNAVESMHQLLDNKNCFSSYAWHDLSLSKSWGKGIINLYYEQNDTSNKYNSKKINTKFNLKKYKQPFNFYNSYSIKFINKIYLILNRLKARNIVGINDLNFPINSFPIYLWYYLNGNIGFIESQVIIPFKNFLGFNNELKDTVFKNNVSIYANVMKIFNGSKSNLSFDGEGVCINYEFLSNIDNDFFDIFYKIVEKNNGITALYKDSKIPKYYIKSQYKEKFEYFLNYINEIDNGNKFTSYFSEKLRR